jgi:hypothetical protein
VTITYEAGVVPKTKDQCRSGGWQNVVDDQGRPFRNQGLCIAFVQHQLHA